MLKRFTLALTLALASSMAMAQNLMVVQVGDGAAALTSASTAGFLKKYTTAGALVSTITLPIAASGANQPLTFAGTSTSEGSLNLSTDGQYMTLGGYAVGPGTAAVAGTTAATVNRVIGRVDAAGTIDTSTALSDAYSASNIRGAMTQDGTAFWTSGTSSTAAAAGVRYVSALGATTSIQLSSTPTNIRVVSIQNGQLYFSSATATFQGVSMCGTGVPTTTGQTSTLLPGFPMAAGPSNYDFWFASATTLYVADDRTVALGGGIQRWDEVGGTWGLTYTMNTGLPAGCRSLAGTTSGDATVIYAVTAQSSANNLVSVTDTGAGSTFTTIATAPTNTAFRGLDWAPVTPPTTVLPTSFTRLGGSDGGGTLASLFVEDSDRLGNQCDELDPNPSLEVVTTSPTASVTQLQFKIVTRASRTDMGILIQLWDYVNSTWVSFSGGSTTLADSTDTVTITIDPNRFINQTTLEMKSQILISPTAEVDGFDGWGGAYNQTVWILN